jgi:hypothetical protein
MKFQRMQRGWGSIHEHGSLVAILLLFLILATLYNLTLPLYEAPDEQAHFRFVYWLASGQGLPNIEKEHVTLGHEIRQPPLYYALLAPFISLINTTDIDTIAPYNPDWDFGGSRIIHFHTAAEAFPYQNTALAVHLARFVSTLLAMLTIVCTYGIARRITPELAVLAAALVAFNPQFLFISAAVNNDTLVAALSTAVLYWLTCILVAAEVPWWHYLILGGLWGLAVLAKATGLALGGVICLGLILRTRWQTGWRSLIVGLVGSAAGLMVVAGWWFIRNWILYDEPLAWSQSMNAIRGLLRSEPLGWLETLRYSAFLRKSYWGMFGNGIPAPDIFYFMVNALMIAGLIGLLIFLARRRYREFSVQQRSVLVLLVFWTALVFALLLFFARQVLYSDQGRLLFPAIGCLALLLALGLTNLGGRRLGTVSAAILGVWAVALPLLVIRPAFAQPEPLPTEFTIPNPIDVTFGQELALLGFELEQESVKRGETLTLTLYWQRLRPIADNYVVRLTAVDSAGQAVAHLDTVPYGGRYPTVVWSSAGRFADRYILPPLSTTAAPGLGKIRVSVYPIGHPAERLDVAVAEGPIGPDIALAPFVIPPDETRQVRPQQLLDETFGTLARLIGYDAPANIAAGQDYTITLYWEVLEPDGRDYTVFVHLLDEQGRLIEQADGPPQDNNYPTSYWAAGEIIADPHTLAGDLSIPPGRYQPVIGLYDPATGQRIPILQTDGSSRPNHEVTLDEVTVVE